MHKKRASPAGKRPNEEAYRRQVEALKLFLSKHTVTLAQYDKSCRDLTEKMHIKDCRLTKSEYDAERSSICVDPSVTADAVPPVSTAGSVGASACGRGVHRTPAPFQGRLDRRKRSSLPCKGRCRTQ